MQKALSFGNFSVLAAKTDLDSPALKNKKEAIIVATYNSQLGSKLHYHKLTLILITRSSTSLSALHVVVLFEPFTIAISLRKRKNHNNMYIHSWVLIRKLAYTVPLIYTWPGENFHPMQLFSIHIFVRCCLSEDFAYVSSG